ncbi:hypothetical protein [Neobacillus sp. 19]|uniref:hypothetical protein n=1 Tax=Neobacillus sp. 19 TaxID=3394458 RepID=UPI003BF6D6EB
MDKRFFVIELYDGFLHKDGKHITKELELAFEFTSLDDAESYIKRNEFETNEYVIRSYKLVKLYND